MWTRLKTWTGRLRSSQDDKVETEEVARVDPSAAELRVLMVCMGNICRSPMAEGVLRERLLDQAPGRIFFVDSAGTHSYHAGAPPDPRAQAAAARRGVAIEDLRARRVETGDFETFDLLLAMDVENLAHLKEIAPEGQAHKARLLLDFSAQRRGGEVPDPYYGGATGFEFVLDMLEEAMDGLLPEIERLARLRRRG